MDSASIGNLGLRLLQGQASQDTAATANPADTSAATPGEALQSFGNILKNSLEEVNKLQTSSDQATQTLALGGPISTHQVFMAAEKAEMSLDMTMQIRNKLLSAYTEISHLSL